MNFTLTNVISLSILALGTFISLMGVPVILHSGKWRLLPNRLLAFYLSCMGIIFAVTFLVRTALILDVYWLFRLPSPLYYLMFPAGFLYVKTLLRDRNKLDKKDYLHFIPGMLHFFEMLPYYLKSKEFKIRHITEILKDPFGSFAHNEGWLPPYLHNIIRGVMGIIYGALIVYVVLRFRSKYPGLKKTYPGLLVWLLVFGSMLFAFGVVVTYTLAWGRIIDPKSQSAVLMIGYSITQIITGFVLFLYPAYLYGMPRISMTPVERKENEMANKPFVPESQGISSETITEIQEDDNEIDAYSSEEALLMDIYQAYKIRLESLMIEKKPYLQEHYKVADLSRDLGIPQHHVTILLNRILKTRFNDYINYYRIQHIRQLIREHGLSHTLEGLAYMAGFSNRSTFIRAVQRVTGESPSRYFQVKK